jgi:L-ascorbate metabolism protein UlaG (beta-lactamase superfamily)
MDLIEIGYSLTKEAENLGWKRDSIKLASTGSIYIELVRDGREWVVIRVSDHKQFYHYWLTTYSLSPYEYDYQGIIDVLYRPFGETGDVLL